MTRRKIVIYSVLSAFILYLFIIFDINFHGPDEPVYLAYTQSIVEDGDLNLINQVYYDYGQIVTKTYNLPDFRNHGGIVLWVPFYLYVKSLYSIADKLGIGYFAGEGYDRLINCAMSFSTVIFGLLSLILTYFICRRYFSRTISILAILVIFLGTPFFYYMVFEVGNSNIIGCLFAVLSILFCSFMKDFKRQHWLVYGLFFSICVIVRRELLLQAFFIAGFYIFLVSSRQINWKNGIYFLFGSLLPVILKITNDSIKYGVWPYIEVAHWFIPFLNIFSINNINELAGLGSGSAPVPRFDGFFDSFRGIFYTSPVFYICVFGFLLLAISLLKKIKNKNVKNEDIFLIILSLYLAVKMLHFVDQFNPSGESLAGRLLFAEFPIFVLLFVQVLQKKYLIYPTLIISLFLVLWNLLVVSEFMTGLDWAYIPGMPSLMERLPVLKYVAYTLFCAKDLGVKLKVCLPIVLVFYLILYYTMRRKIHRQYNRPYNANISVINALSLFAIYSFVLYFSFTLLNIANNKKNTEKLKQEGFLKNARIIETSLGKPTIYQDEEWYTERFNAQGYLALKGKIDMFKQNREKDPDRRKILRLYPLPIRLTYNKLATFFQTSGRYQKAIDCYQEKIKIDPEDIEAYISLGDIYSSIGNYNKAFEYYKQALTINPDIVKLYIYSGNICEKIGNLGQAIEFYQKAILHNPTFFEVYISLGNIYRDTGDYGKATEYYLKCLEFNPNVSEVYSDLGCIYNNQGNYAKAIECLTKALQLRPDSFDAHTTLAGAYQSQGNYPKAIEYLTKALQLRPDSFDAHTTLAGVYQSQADYAKASEHFKKIIQLYPKSTDAYVSLGNIYLTQCNYAKALEYLNKAIQLNPDCADAYSNLGNTYNCQGDYDKAINNFRRYLRFHPESIDTYRTLVDAYKNKGDIGNAMKQIKRLRELGKNDLAEELEKSIKIKD